MLGLSNKIKSKRLSRLSHFFHLPSKHSHKRSHKHSSTSTQTIQPPNHIIDNQWEAIIGLEIHAQLSSKTKLFSSVYTFSFFFFSLKIVIVILVKKIDTAIIDNI